LAGQSTSDNINLRKPIRLFLKSDDKDNIFDFQLGIDYAYRVFKNLFRHGEEGQKIGTGISQI